MQESILNGLPRIKPWEYGFGDKGYVRTPVAWPVSKFRLGPTQISFRYFGDIHPNFAKLLGRNDLCKAPSQQQNFFESFERRNLENTERKRLKEPYTHQHMQQQ